MTNIEPYRQIMKTNIKEHNDMVDKINEIVDVVNNTNLEAFAKLTVDVNALKSDVVNINAKDNEQDASIGASESDIASLKTNDDYLSDKVEQMETDLIATEQAVATNQSDIATLKGSDASQNAKITAIQGKDTEQDASIDNLVSGLANANTEITALSTSLISDVEMTDGTTAGSVQVTLIREDNQQITSTNYRWGRDIGARLQAGATPNTFKLLIDLSDGTVIESNEYLSSHEVVEGDIYVTAITLVPDVANGQLGGTISYSNGTTQTINKVAVPTSPGVTSSIESLQARMTEVESKNTSQDTAINGLGTRLTTAEGKITTAQTDISNIKNKNIEQDGEITSLDARVTAIEDTPGIGKFTNSNLGTILGSTTDGFVSADAQGRGKVSGWDSLKTRITTAEQQIVSVQSDVSALDRRVGTHDTAINGKVAIAQGTANAGKVLGIGPDGNVMPAEVSGGGEEWEEVDLNNWPTDWVNGDRIRLTLQTGIQVTSKPTSWTSPISNSNITFFNNGLYYLDLMITIYDIIKTPYMLVSFSNDETAMSVMRISQIGSVSSFNSGTSNIITLSACAWNGSGIKDNTLSIKPSNISTYVYKMWRLKNKIKQFN